MQEDLEAEMNHMVMAAFRYLELNPDRIYQDVVDYFKKILIVQAIKQTHGYNSHEVLKLNRVSFGNYITRLDLHRYLSGFKMSKKWRKLRRQNARRRRGGVVQGDVEKGIAG